MIFSHLFRPNLSEEFVFPQNAHSWLQLRDLDLAGLGTGSHRCNCEKCPHCPMQEVCVIVHPTFFVSVFSSCWFLLHHSPTSFLFCILQCHPSLRSDRVIPVVMVKNLQWFLIVHGTNPDFFFFNGLKGHSTSASRLPSSWYLMKQPLSHTYLLHLNSKAFIHLTHQNPLPLPCGVLALGSWTN